MMSLQYSIIWYFKILILIIVAFIFLHDYGMYDIVHCTEFTGVCSL